MKDEELAEEIVKRNVCGDCNRCQSHGYIGCDIYRYSKDSCLAGLKAGRPQWHDLRKDPNDLPKFEGDYMCALLNSNHSSFILSLAIEDGLKYWQDCESTDWTNEVIAWCELPTFD